ncbi:unnamed protein product [Psylliodes chrysocephalus]|uniref:Uncharacterized protein n=1 Tax=Psylliodes chrysocephalus TaxID=3402493 RepID=A0A9P0CFE5_9CUCU|nr:unnamed protein product [Psylliodes chrysocephala]
MDSFVCKIVVIRTDDRKILKSKNIENNFLRPTRAVGIKKCLFGVASIEDTEKMLQEQYDIDRRRFSERFGIDLKKIEESERESNSENIVSNNGSSQIRKNYVMGRKIIKRKRDVFKQQNIQTVMTDFYQARKTMQSTEKPSKNTKEN